MKRMGELCQDALAVLLKVGCVRLPFLDKQWTPTPLSQEFIAETTNQSRMQQISEETCAITSTYTRLSVVLEVAVVDVTAAGKTLAIDCYIPRAVRRAPTVVILPILGGKDYTLECYFARYFVEHGFAALVLHREKVQLINEGKQVDLLFRQSVLDGRRVFDWIETRPELDAHRNIHPKKVLLLLAVCDKVVFFKKGLQLWRAMGKPETIILMSGHYSAALYLPYIRRAVLKFFKRRLS